MWNTLIAVAVSLAMLASAMCWAGASDTPAIETAEQAYDRAVAYTGCDRMAAPEIRDSQAVASLVVYHDSTTPFIWQSLDGRAAWRLTFEDPDLLDDDSGAARQRASRIWTLWIDSLSGSLLKGEARLVEPGESLSRAPVADESPRFLEWAGERYLEMAPSLPILSLREALNRCKAVDRHAKTIVFRHVIMNSMEIVIKQPEEGEFPLKLSAPYPAWVLWFPDYTANSHMRQVINSSTGASRGPTETIIGAPPPIPAL